MTKQIPWMSTSTDDTKNIQSKRTQQYWTTQKDHKKPKYRNPSNQTMGKIRHKVSPQNHST